MLYLMTMSTRYPNKTQFKIVNDAILAASKQVNEIARLEYLERKYINNSRQEPIDRYVDVLYEYDERYE